MAEPYTVIATGWRGARDDRHGDRIAELLIPIQAEHGADVLLRHGQCPYGGVDLIVDQMAAGFGWQVDRVPAEMRDGRVLGPARNREMCSRGADVVLAYPGPGSRGTWDCLHWAARYDIPFLGMPLQVGGRR